MELDGSYRSLVRGNCQHGVGGLNKASELDGMIVAESDNWTEVKVEGIVYVTKDFDTLEEIKVSNSVVEFIKPNQVLNKSVQK